MATVYVGSKGGRYTLGKSIGGGGEGEIFDVGHGDVAKVYHSPDPSRDAKIRAMAAIPLPPGAAGMVAWPKEVLMDPRTGGVVGFVMPRLTTKYALDVFTEYPRIEEKPQPDGYRTYYSIAYNTALVVRSLHDAGLVIGDFNGENIGYTSDGQPVFYDADSFHVPGYPCVVCRPEYVPAYLRPALKVGLDKYAGETFSVHTDDWALAVHIFELLMNGCHPYASRPTGSGDALSLREAINAGACTFFRDVNGYEPPPYAPSLEILPPEIRRLFARAFVGFKSDIPSAAEWEAALGRVLAGPFAPVCGVKHHGLPATATAGGCPLCRAYADYCRIAGTGPSMKVNTTKSAGKAVTSGISPGTGSATAPAGKSQRGGVKARAMAFGRGLVRRVRGTRAAGWVRRGFKVLWAAGALMNAVSLGILAFSFASMPDSYALHAAILATSIKLLLSIAVSWKKSAPLGALAAAANLAMARLFPEAMVFGDASAWFAWLLLGISAAGYVVDVRRS